MTYICLMRTYMSQTLKHSCTGAEAKMKRKEVI
jgi:hypothetical protein